MRENEQQVELIHTRLIPSQSLSNRKPQARVTRSQKCVTILENSACILYSVRRPKRTGRTASLECTTRVTGPPSEER